MRYHFRSSRTGDILVYDHPVTPCREVLIYELAKRIAQPLAIVNQNHLRPQVYVAVRRWRAGHPYTVVYRLNRPAQFLETLAIPRLK